VKPTRRDSADSSRLHEAWSEEEEREDEAPPARAVSGRTAAAFHATIDE
jgi:hypothetical protein